MTLVINSYSSMKSKWHLLFFYHYCKLAKIKIHIWYYWFNCFYKTITYNIRDYYFFIQTNTKKIIKYQINVNSNYSNCRNIPHNIQLNYCIHLIDCYNFTIGIKFMCLWFCQRYMWWILLLWFWLYRIINRFSDCRILGPN